jgi:NAD+ synthase
MTVVKDDRMDPRVLAIDAAQVTEEIVADLGDVVRRRLRRGGAVVGVSGGVDSAVAAALCVRAFGADRVLALLTPERESAPDTLELSRLVTSSLGLEPVVEDITATLEAVGCYRRRDAAIREALPAYGPGWKAKLALPPLEEDGRFRLFQLIAEAPDGDRRIVRLPADPYRRIVAATSFKQRTRKMVEYFHADASGYAVIGTPNRLEYDQGFFVKGGDGAADVKPLAHLYKTQVYELGRHLGLPEIILDRPPTTDTYPLPQTQEEFYFSLPYDQLDLCLYARNHRVSAESVAQTTGLSPAQVARVFEDIDRKRKAAEYLHLPPQLLQPADET